MIKTLYVVFSILVMYFHYDIYSCMNCSYRHVWWNSWIIKHELCNFIPVIYIALQIVSTLTVVLGIHRIFLLRLIDPLIGLHTTLNILYWAYVAYFLQDSIYNTYIMMNMLYMSFYIQCLWGDKNNIALDDLLDS
ncbi:hypothetical protein AsAng_0005330 [Aureispira anguillae]|uniref:Uncharacterized protein n=1 Tax=Aureispira anguillae TaxID=2864201 RepID=A0A915YB48_9BACT|nr:hypothetical protein AsAng_0005330 [Aureispira anguillae]